MIEGLNERLEAIFKLQPAAIAIEQDGVGWTYAATTALVKDLDILLVEHGLGPATPVGVLLRNSPAALAVALGVIWSERCLVTVNPMLPSAPLQEDLKGLHVPVLIADRSDWDNPIFFESAAASGALGISWRAVDGRFDLDKVLEPRTGIERRPEAPGIAIEMLTSGTTGKPKRIRLELASL